MVKVAKSLATKPSGGAEFNYIHKRIGKAASRSRSRNTREKLPSPLPHPPAKTPTKPEAAEETTKGASDDGDELASLFEGSDGEVTNQHLCADASSSERESTPIQTPGLSKGDSGQMKSESKVLDKELADQILRKTEANNCTKTTTTETKPAEKLQGNRIEKSATNDELDAAKQAEGKFPPKITNSHNACFANAPLQCLFGVPELADRCETSAEVILDSLRQLIKAFPDLDRKGYSAQRASQRKLVTEKFRGTRDFMYEAVPTRPDPLLTST